MERPPSPFQSGGNMSEEKPTALDLARELQARVEKELADKADRESGISPALAEALGEDSEVLRRLRKNGRVPSKKPRTEVN